MTEGKILICFYGPESTGKSTLVRQLAQLYNTEYVPEVARELITSNDFSREDIIRIGYAQTERVFKKLKLANRFLFCDTDLITTQIYCRHYLGAVPDVLFDLERQVTYDHYFLFDVDVAWVADGMRDLGTEAERQAMFQIFKGELERRGISFTHVLGSYEARTKIVKARLDEIRPA